MKLVKNSSQPKCFSELEKIFQNAIEAGAPLNVLQQARLFRQKKPTNVSLKLIENVDRQ